MACRDQNGQIDGVFDPRNCDVLAVLRGLVGTSTACGLSAPLDRPRNRGLNSGHAESDATICTSAIDDALLLWPPLVLREQLLIL